MAAIFFFIFFDDFMRNSNFGIGVLHVKTSNIDVFVLPSFLRSLKFWLYYRIEYHKRCLLKKVNYGSVFVIWLYLQKAMYRPCYIALCHMKVTFCWWVDYDHMSILYKFQIDISSNSREIKYKTILAGHTDTHTQGVNNTSQPPPGAR